MSTSYFNVLFGDAGSVLGSIVFCLANAFMTYFLLSQNPVNHRARHLCFLALAAINFTFDSYSVFRNPWSAVLVLSRLCFVRIFVDIQITRSRKEWKRALIDHTPFFDFYDFLVRALDEIEVDT
jgi:Ca2+/Na+ antiporter